MLAVAECGEGKKSANPSVHDERQPKLEKSARLRLVWPQSSAALPFSRLPFRGCPRRLVIAARTGAGRRGRKRLARAQLTLRDGEQRGCTCAVAHTHETSAVERASRDEARNLRLARPARRCRARRRRRQRLTPCSLLALHLLAQLPSTHCCMSASIELQTLERTATEASRDKVALGQLEDDAADDEAPPAHKEGAPSSHTPSSWSPELVPLRRSTS